MKLIILAVMIWTAPHVEPVIPPKEYHDGCRVDGLGWDYPYQAPGDDLDECT